jgi:hypothetical protein
MDQDSVDGKLRGWEGLSGQRDLELRWERELRGRQWFDGDTVATTTCRPLPRLGGKAKYSVSVD